VPVPTQLDASLATESTRAPPTCPDQSGPSRALGCSGKLLFTAGGEGREVLRQPYNGLRLSGIRAHHASASHGWPGANGHSKRVLDIHLLRTQIQILRKLAPPIEVRFRAFGDSLVRFLPGIPSGIDVVI
jgi:hypothetical protein